VVVAVDSTDWGRRVAAVTTMVGSSVGVAAGVAGLVAGLDVVADGAGVLAFALGLLPLVEVAAGVEAVPEGVAAVWAVAKLKVMRARRRAARWARRWSCF
jgi:hypothetical protein